MIDKDINPKNNIYYLGAKVIEIISKEKTNDFFDVFGKLNNLENVSINLYTLTLDWLFIIGVIKESKEHSRESISGCQLV